jgi:enoyl-CoA hydratase/carnithine racemase
MWSTHDKSDFDLTIWYQILTRCCSTGLLESRTRAKQFYREQAEMINDLYYMKKPVVSFIHGRAHGVGAGMALFQTMPMVTPSAVVSSPGSRYGMSGADAGLSYLFSRLPGHLGEFYLLTGKNITGSDLVTLGLAKFYMKDYENLLQLQELLSHNDSHDLHQILEFVKMFHNSPETSKVAYFADIINDCFSKANVHEIVAALDKVQFKWASAIAAILRDQDPAVAEATLLACRRARFSSISECLQTEFTLASRLIDRPNWKKSVQMRLAPHVRRHEGMAQLWAKTPAETRAAAEALLAPLPKEQRLNLPVRQNLEHYQRRPDYNSEIGRSHELEPSRADLHYTLEELAPQFRNGKFTRNSVKRYVMSTLSEVPGLRQQMQAFRHQVEEKSQTLVESGLWGTFSKQTST